MCLPPRLLQTALITFTSAGTLWPQAIQDRSAKEDPGAQILSVSQQLPEPVFAPVMLGEVSLLPGLFRDRRELTKAYLLRLKNENILQNHLLESGVRIGRPAAQMHQGWEAPHCQVRGHFAGHWLSAAAEFAAVDHDPIMALRTQQVVTMLKRCQELNGGQWVASIPEKYFDMLVDERLPIWSPQYTVHKTLMGLYDDYRYAGNKDALTIVEHAADWFSTWTEKLAANGRGDAVYTGECSGMLELWADLFSVTQDPRYLKLASRYARPDLFNSLLAGKDGLTNGHTNASIPWIHGAARLYEVTGEPRYREIVEAFWKQAVEMRGMFATTGNNSGEHWIPPQQFGKFLSSRTQEHCTVYNMIRVAQYLLKWTGDSRYADYIERALYNGILAQQNPGTGMVAYFLPLQPGAKKIWGSETNDFWCCHGTMVQAQAMFEGLIYYRSGSGVAVAQFIPSEAAFGNAGQQIRIKQQIDDSDHQSNFLRSDDVTRFVVNLTIASEVDEPWTLRIRQPNWTVGDANMTVDGETIAVAVSKSGFLEINRKWKTSNVRVSFSKRLVKEPLPGDSQRFALMDGPVVLAALSEKEPALLANEAITPQYERLYVNGQDWQTKHYLVRTNQGTIAVKPLYEIADESYCVYFDSLK